MKKTIFLFLVYLLMGCATNTQEKDAQLNREVIGLKPESGLRKTKMVRFSDSIQADIFRLEALGKELANSQVVFSVVSYRGTVIYKKTFSPDELLGYDNSIDGEVRGDQISEKDWLEKLVRNKFNIFFNDQNFHKDAIEDDVQYYSDSCFPEEPIWEMIKQNRYPSFSFNVMDELVFQIVYVPQLNKVVEFAQ
ncbi:MAG: hypothetical protein V4616_00880 [Bacteroidota bacterium]